MKKLLLLVFLVVSFTCFSQDTQKWSNTAGWWLSTNYYPTKSILMLILDRKENFSAITG